jgi:hypothetical protein
MKEFYKEMPKDKIKINWNKKPIKMDLFLSFLTVPTERQTRFLGSDTGWTQLTGGDRLEIGGGVVKGTEYLDRLQYKKNLDNPYNHYVNPFYLFDILNDEGRVFFLEYYSDEICLVLKQAKNKAICAESSKEELFKFWETHGVDTNEI